MLQTILRRLPTTVVVPARRSLAASSFASTSGSTLESRPKLVYSVTRTASGSLPVYSELKNDNHRVSTIVRKIGGNIDVLTRELSSFYPQAQIFAKQSQIVLRGNYVKEVKEWLSAKGF